MIMGSMIGSAGAAAVVKTSQEALKSWPELDRKQKSEVLNKLKELKAKAKETLSADLSAAPAEKKTAASEKADAAYQQFKAAVKKRVEQEKGGGDEKEEDPQVTKWKKTIEEDEATMAKIEPELEKAKEEQKKKDQALNDYKATSEYKNKRGYDAKFDELQTAWKKAEDNLKKIQGQYDYVKDNVIFLKRKIKETTNESSSYKSTRHVMLFEEFVNKLY